MSKPRNKRLICADTVYGLIQSANDILRDRFTTKGRTLDDNSWRTCPVTDLESGFWQAVRDRDFGSVLTYTIMLGGRDVNVADIVHGMIDKYDVQFERAEAKLIAANDTIRLQRLTISQHEQTIKDLRTKLEDKGINPDEPNGSWAHQYYGPVTMGTEIRSKYEDKPELCYSVESICGDLVETIVIQGDPAAVKDLVQAIRAEKAACDIPMAHNIVIHSLDPRIAELVKESAQKGAAKTYDDVQNISINGGDSGKAV